jgi:hypothetical protein
MYLIRFFNFGAVLCASGFKVWKCTNMTFIKNVLEKINKGIKKTQNFMLISYPLKKFLKSTKKKL